MKAHSKGTSHQQGETQPGQAEPGDAGWHTDLEIQVLPTTMDIAKLKPPLQKATEHLIKLYLCLTQKKGASERTATKEGLISICHCY